MTKKYTWSGYRGKGRPVIPCVPECSVEKTFVGNSSRAKAPTDYRKPSERVPSSPRKELKFLRNKLVYHRYPVRPYAHDDHSQLAYYRQWGKANVAQDAYRAGDLDLLRTYYQFSEVEPFSYSLDLVYGAALALRSTGVSSVHGNLTTHHVRVYSHVNMSVQAYHSSFYLEEMDWQKIDLVPEAIKEIAAIAFLGDREEAVVSTLIKRQITDPEQIRNMVHEMTVDSIPLFDGVL